MQLRASQGVRENSSTAGSYRIADGRRDARHRVSRERLRRTSVGAPRRRASRRSAVPLRTAAEAPRLRRLSPRSSSTSRSSSCCSSCSCRYPGSAVTPRVLPDETQPDIIWLSEPGPGGGGGGGGNKMKEPPRQAELPGKDKITVPVEKPPKLEAPQQAKDEPNPVEQLNIPAKSLASATRSLPGAIDAPPGPPTLSQGSGSGGGAGTGTGRASAPGTGSGLGAGIRRRHGRRRLPAGQRRRRCRGWCAKSSRSTPPTRCARRCRAPCCSSASCGRTASVGDVQVVRSLDLDVRSRSGSHQGRQAVALRAGHAPGRAGLGPRHDRAHVHAAVDTARSPDGSLRKTKGPGALARRAFQLTTYNLES